MRVIETAIAEAQGSIAAFRQFGAWLDDASAPTRGEGYTSFGASYWRMPGVSQTNLPAFGAGMGVTDRLLVSGSVPFYQVRWADGSARGLDDVYLSAKYTLVDPTLSLSEVGVAVGAVAEILSSGVDRRLHFALPVSVEVLRLPFRVYGSAGYFTRGSIFGAGAVEWTSPSYLTLTGAVTQSYSLEGDPLLDTLAVGRQRVDLTFGAAYPVARVASVYGSVGRSLRSANQDPTQLAVSGGVAFRFRALPSRP
jgi:hypothetical protein